jgi:hypothetical protein
MTARTWQGIPDWLIYAVRWQHAEAMTEGRERAGEDAVQKLTDKVLAGDPEFARVIVERYIRSLVRAPKARKRTKDDKARDRLMAECARMSAEGMSLRAIARAKGISHQSAANLIAEWQACLPEMSPDLIRLATPAVNLPRQNGAADLTASVDSDPNVIPLRRPA